MKNLTRVVTIVFGALIVLIIVAMLIYKSPTCLGMYNGIESDLEKANHCEQDSDCTYIMLGGKYIEFGCAHYINNDTDQQKIYGKMDKYADKCSKIINKCMPIAAPSCVGGKCIYTDENVAVSYIACGCGCCSNESAREECLYHSKGDDMNVVMESDKAQVGSPGCENVGCSYPVKYVYCD
jgi:hypothetical protein